MSQQTMGLSVIDDSISAQPPPQEQELVALKESVRKIIMVLEASGVKADEIIADFQKARQREITAETSELFWMQKSLTNPLD